MPGRSPPAAVRPAVLVLVALLAPLASAAPGSIDVPPALSGRDTDGIDIPYDRCPDRGEAGAVDDQGCPIDPRARFGDADGDGLMNGKTVSFGRPGPLFEALVKADIVRGVTREGRWVFLGEESVGTDPFDADTDGDRLGDGLEVAMRHGLTAAGRPVGTFGRVIEPAGVPRADPLAPDAYLALHPTILGNRTHWNDALDAAVEQVVADDLAPEGNATYTPRPVRLHVFVDPALPLADDVLTTDEALATGEAAVVQQYLVKARRPIATYVVAAPSVVWDGNEVAGLAFDRFVLVGLMHKGLDACDAAGGVRDAPACAELTRLVRWTLNHERFHHFGLADTLGEDTLMSTAPGVYAPRPSESATRDAFIARQPVVLDWH